MTDTVDTSSGSRTTKRAPATELPRSQPLPWLEALERRLPWAKLTIAAIVVVGVAGVVLRLWTSSQLWLDEALTVNIAKLPVGQIPHALRRDGAPPLYYLLLHYWMAVLGTGNVAARSLSGVISLISLPLFWAAGRRIGGRRTAWIAFVVAASSPFAVSYATSVRMYSMMATLSLAGLLAIQRALERPTRGRLACVVLVTAASLYTHYWALYLVVVTVLLLAWRSWTATAAGPQRLRRLLGAARPSAVGSAPPSVPVLLAVLGGCVLFLPWVPTFVFQTLHTGTPWTGAAGPADLLHLFGTFANGGYFGGGPWASLLTFLLFGLVFLGIFGVGIDRGRLELSTRVRPVARPLYWSFLGTVVLAVALGAAAQAAFVGRYTSVVFPLFILLVALGVSAFRDPRLLAAVTVLVCVSGLIVGVTSDANARTQAGVLAADINAEAKPGDLVLYCPDQLGPSTSRLITVPGLTQLTFPRAYPPQRVDWVDYKKVIARTNVVSFAEDIVARAGNGTIWYVWRDGYPSFGADCGNLYNWLAVLRPHTTEVVGPDPGRYYENAGIDRFSR